MGEARDAASSLAFILTRARQVLPAFPARSHCQRRRAGPCGSPPCVMVAAARYDWRALSFTSVHTRAPRRDGDGNRTMGESAGKRARDSTTLLDEAAMVARAQHDPRAFAPLYEAYADAVYRYCYRRLGNPDAAADATSAIFTRALGALPRYHHRSFRSWLFTIAHNTLVDGWRTAHLTTSLEERIRLADPGPGPEEVVLDQDAGREVRALLAKLPADQRQVVELRLADLTNQEIASILGRSVAATKMLQVRALTRLRALLDPAPVSGDRGQR